MATSACAPACTFSACRVKVKKKLSSRGRSHFNIPGIAYFSPDYRRQGSHYIQASAHEQAITPLAACQPAPEEPPFAPLAGYTSLGKSSACIKLSRKKGRSGLPERP